MDYNHGEVQNLDGYEQKFYSLDGTLIYSYQFTDGVKNGKAIEVLSNVSNITHRLEIIKYRSSYQGNWNDFHNFKDTKHQSYNNQTYRLVPYLNPYLKQHQYQISHHRFAGFNQYDIKNKQFLDGQIIGTGHYENNIRIGKWVWKTMDDNKLAIKGQYNEKGQPIGEWKEIDPNDDSNSIITQYDENGKVKSVSRKSKTYSKK